MRKITNKWALAATCALALMTQTEGGFAKSVQVGHVLAPKYNDSALYSFSVLHSFTGGSGAFPYAGLNADKEGNFYGATYGGGTYSIGTVYKLAPDGTETVLHSFKGGSDGALPYFAVPIADKKGNRYGTTIQGGDYNWGTIFKITPDGKETVLHSFTDGSDGAFPFGGLIKDSSGNLYGTTYYGAGNGCYNGYGCGTVFRMSRNGNETVLHAFTGSPGDGANPYAVLVADQNGNLFGTTSQGGANNYGTVFEVSPNGTETVLYSFTGGSDGILPFAGLIRDSSGNFYGTTQEGGAYGWGTVFKLVPNGTETVLHSFAGGTDGLEPVGGLVASRNGSVYGTTEGGGGTGCYGYGCGTVFKLAPDGTETVLHSFTGGTDGLGPVAGLIKDSSGNLYGTTQEGGDHGGGTVFMLKK